MKKRTAGKSSSKTAASKRQAKDLPPRNDARVSGGAPSVKEIPVVKSTDSASTTLFSQAP